MAVDVLASPPKEDIILCESEVVRVDVFARGAIVTRSITPSRALPKGDAWLKISGITPDASAQSARLALAPSSRALLSLASELHIPLHDTGAAGSQQQLDELNAQLEHLELRLAALSTQRTACAQLSITPQRSVEWREAGPVAMLQRGLGLHGVLDEHIAQLDAQLALLQTQQRELELARRHAQLDLAHASTARSESSEPTWTFLAHVHGDQPVDALQLTYVVERVRWWPLYTLHLREAGLAAEIMMEAVIAQNCGEDWESVALTLSTAELIQDARLPELPALKLGKAQPPKRTGYREVPSGLERLFAGYDRARGVEEINAAASSTAMMRGGLVPTGHVPQKLMDRRQEAQARAPMEAMDLMEDDFEAVDDYYDDDDSSLERASRAPNMEMMKSRSAGILPSLSFGGAPPAAAAPMRSKSKKRAPAPPPPPEPELEPQDAWLDFDSLEMPELHHHARGRLRMRAQPEHHSSRDLDQAEDEAERLGAKDPMYSDRRYEHQFESAMRADLPSDGRLHRVEMQRATGPSTLWWRGVPLERPEVFRMARILNPMEAPLLAGPLDVFVEGSFLLSTQLGHVDRGEQIVVGLGVDDRVKLVRNVRTHEESLGLLGGKTSVAHTVTLTLVSNLPFPARVEVLDRVPVTKQSSLSIEEISSSPTASEYTQIKEGHKIDGGRRWEVDLQAKEERELTLAYTLVFSSREEIQGGNRRD